jgi:hypothetical protein
MQNLTEFLESNGEMKKEKKREFLMIVAAFAAVIMFFVILDSPAEVFESIMKTLGF